MSTHGGFATQQYLAELSAGLVGSRRSRKRLLAEVRDHIQDAIAAREAIGIDPAEAERQALNQIGPVSTVASYWGDRTLRARKRRDKRVALAVTLATVTSVLGITKAADGRRDPAPVHCAHAVVAHGHCRAALTIQGN
jgi:hypothetical protein